MFKQFRHIKSIITVSFIALITLCLFGIVMIYFELIKFSEVSSIPSERKELVAISNTLAVLYQAEGSENLMFSDAIPGINIQYDSLICEVHIQIDSLKKISQDSILSVHLDSVTTLLDKKRSNMFRMLQLLDSVNRRTINPLTKTTILSRRDVDNIDKFLKNSVQIQDDTVKVKSEKKNFFQRVKAVFDPQTQDSSVMISRNQIENIDSIDVPVVTDTIVEYFNDLVFDYNRKNDLFLNRLVKRQGAMHRMNEEMTVQINKILRDIENREYRASLDLLNEKEIMLKRSTRIAYVVGLVALVMTILFLVIILQALNYNQKYRNELEKSKRYTEDLLHAKERLILTITHDIKAPVSSIIGYIELLLNSKLPAREKYYVENMQLSAEHVLELVKNLLDFHSLGSDNSQINKMTFIPCILLKDICESFIPQAEKSKIKMVFDCNLDRTEIYESDPYRIRQIIGNILSNAVKFTPSGGQVTVKSSILPGNGSNSMLSISVKDTGKGISKENQAVIFEEFLRLDENRNIEGSGLGLAITKKLIDLLQGDIKIISEEGNGSEFVVQIPVVKINSGGIELPVIIDDEKEFSELPDTNRKILFIDDDLVQLNLFSELLKRKGFVPVVCQNSVDALDLIQKGRFDMIFTDIQMPGMNGFELVERIRMATFKGSKTLPVIALSASSNISEQKFVEAGFSGFLPKPFTAAQLMDIILLYVGDDNVCMPIRNNKELKGFEALINFANDDVDASREIIRTFIDENKKNVDVLQQAFDLGDWDTVKKVCHKMLPLMRMISDVKIVHILCEFEKGSQDKEKGAQLISSVLKLLDEADVFLSDLK